MYNIATIWKTLYSIFKRALYFLYFPAFIVYSHSYNDIYKKKILFTTCVQLWMCTARIISSVTWNDVFIIYINSWNTFSPLFIIIIAIIECTLSQYLFHGNVFAGGGGCYTCIMWILKFGIFSLIECGKNYYLRCRHFFLLNVYTTSLSQHTDIFFSSNCASKQSCLKHFELYMDCNTIHAYMWLSTRLT